MADDDLYRILIKGGVTSPGELKDYIVLLESVGLEHVSFGSRQDLLFPVLSEVPRRSLEQFAQDKEELEGNRAVQNIVTSYVASDIFDATHWLKGSTYLYLLEEFDFKPRLKINITDPKQRLVPIFSGNLNFIASEHEDYWFLHILLPHWEHGEFYPVLVYTWDIVPVCREIERCHREAQSIEDLFFLVQNHYDAKNKAFDKPLLLTQQTFPYYEGINRMGIDKFWLGLYWRNNRYDLDFLKEFCQFCLDNSIGKICLTPWKSFIVKGIPLSSKLALERLLGIRGINVRHSQLEMNWHIPIDDGEALKLKNYLVRSFDENDISTYGLTFGISADVGKRTHFTAVVVEKNPESEMLTLGIQAPTYNVLYSKNFDPNTRQYIPYAQDVDRSALPGLLMELSKTYFGQLGVYEAIKSARKKAPENILHSVYQCQHCLTIYDESVGDVFLGIEPGTLFDGLPETYACPTCSAPKSGFNAVKINLQP